MGIVCSLALMLQSSQNYPTKPVRMVEPFGAGGGPDVIARAIGPKLAELWGQPVTVGEPSRRGKYSGPRTGREVTRRRLHVAREHQCAGIQRRAFEEPAV